MEMVDLEFMKPGLRGATILVASGDQGVWGRTGVLGGDTFNADYPASSPYVTAVGGTDLKVANVLGDEQAWTDSGGGFSMHATQQSWQADAVNAYLDANETLSWLRLEHNAVPRHAAGWMRDAGRRRPGLRVSL